MGAILGRLLRYQTDITGAGCLFSIAITALFNTVTLVIILSVVMGDLEALGDYFSQAVQLAEEFYQTALAQLRQLVAKL